MILPGDVDSQIYYLGKRPKEPIPEPSVKCCLNHNGRIFRVPQALEEDYKRKGTRIERVATTHTVLTGQEAICFATLLRIKETQQVGKR